MIKYLLKRYFTYSLLISLFCAARPLFDQQGFHLFYIFQIGRGLDQFGVVKVGESLAGRYVGRVMHAADNAVPGDLVGLGEEFGAPLRDNIRQHGGEQPRVKRVAAGVGKAMRLFYAGLGFGISHKGTGALVALLHVLVRLRQVRGQAVEELLHRGGQGLGERAFAGPERIVGLFRGAPGLRAVGLGALVLPGEHGRYIGLLLHRAGHGGRVELQALEGPGVDIIDLLRGRQRA